MPAYETFRIISLFPLWFNFCVPHYLKCFLVTSQRVDQLDLITNHITSTPCPVLYLNLCPGTTITEPLQLQLQRPGWSHKSGIVLRQGCTPPTHTLTWCYDWNGKNVQRGFRSQWAPNAFAITSLGTEDSARSRWYIGSIATISISGMDCDTNNYGTLVACKYGLFW